jgi:hypothetical protein
VLGCEVGEILIPEPGKVSKLGAEESPKAVAAGTSVATPKRRDGRSLPPA